MNSKRFFFVMVAIVVLLGSGLVVSVVAADGILKKQAEKLVSLKLENHLIDQQQLSLVQEKKDIQKYSQLEQIAKTVVPQDKDQAAATREIVKIANDSGVKLSTISFPASSLGQSTVVAPAAGSTGTSTAPKVVTPPVTQVQAVDGIPGLYVMAITIQQDTTTPVSYAKFIDFLNRLEQNRRTAQVSSITVQPTSQDRNKVTFGLVVNVYIKP